MVSALLKSWAMPPAIMPSALQPLLFDDVLLGGAQLAEQFLELRGALVHLLLEPLVLLLQFAVEKAVLEQIVDPQDDLEMIERLGHQVLRAHRQRAPLRVDRDVRREHEDRQVISLRDRGLELLDDAKAVEMRHVQVEQHEIGLKFEILRQRLARDR